MNKQDFLSELSKDGSESILSAHYDIKAQMPIDNAIMLLAAGFSDCSYSNDECPSYCIDTPSPLPLDALVLMYCPRTEEEKREPIIYGEHKPWTVFVYGTGEHEKAFLWLKDAIAYYVKINAQQLHSLTEDK